MIHQWKGDRPPKPVPPQRASALLSACAIQEGWFYARAIGEVLGARCELGELIWLSFRHPDVLEIQREWCKIFCFRWRWRPMPAAERVRLVGIRRHGKTGLPLSEEEGRFCERMFARYPESYREVDAEIREWAARMMNPLAR